MNIIKASYEKLFKEYKQKKSLRKKLLNNHILDIQIFINEFRIDNFDLKWT